MKEKWSVACCISFAVVGRTIVAVPRIDVRLGRPRCVGATYQYNPQSTVNIAIIKEVRRRLNISCSLITSGVTHANIWHSSYTRKKIRNSTRWRPWLKSEFRDAR
ncbi:hypothetical protein DFH94DRAFT_762072 [Russula ochroleuca]|uniref:Uncharacterized protein n=1 Tax=Russula ochroleuca TaxID=152965 RepID=A0A9P5MNF0_9AGAM|nr:hypothetical protein DFH94DRAFT_762072 [Russula ochroleuca]